MHCRDKCQGRTGNDEPLSVHRYHIDTCRFWTLECVSRSASTMLIVWPENIVRRMFAGQDAGNSQSETSVWSHDSYDIAGRTAIAPLVRSAARVQRTASGLARMVATSAMIVPSER